MSRDIIATTFGVCSQDWRKPDRRRRALLLACTALAGFAALPAQAQTWEGNFNGSWNIPANWDNSVVPGPSDDVTIGTYMNAPVIGGYVANVSSVTIGAATIPSVLTITSGELRNFGGPNLSDWVKARRAMSICSLTRSGTAVTTSSSVLTGSAG